MSILGFKRRRSRSAQTDPVDVLDSLVFVAPLFYWYIAFAKAQSIFTPVAEQLTN